MLLEFREDRFGSIIITPVSEAWKDAIDSHMLGIIAIGVIEAPKDAGTEGAYFQEGGPASDVRERYLSLEEQEDLSRGYAVEKEVEDWEALHFWGFDAHTLCEV